MKPSWSTFSWTISKCVSGSCTLVFFRGLLAGKCDNVLGQTLSINKIQLTDLLWTFRPGPIYKWTYSKHAPVNWKKTEKESTWGHLVLWTSISSPWQPPSFGELFIITVHIITISKHFTRIHYVNYVVLNCIIPNLLLWTLSSE